MYLGFYFPPDFFEIVFELDVPMDFPTTVAAVFVETVFRAA